MAEDVRIIDLDPGSVNDSHLFESDDGSSSFKITAIDLRAYCQNGLTPQSIGIAAGVTTTELNYLDGVTSGVQGQIDAKAPINNPIFTGTVSGVTKAMVGLPFVDNTSDINKPISTLQQAGLDGKVSTSITIDTASGLTGGGSLASNRTISLDVPSLTNKTTPSSSDQVLIYDPVSSSHKRTTVSGITSGLSGGAGVTAHSALTGLNADDHPQYSLSNGTRWTVTPTANRVVISTASGVLSSSSISITELGYLSGVTSLIQGQINNKTDSGHTHTIANINNLQADLNTRAVTSRVVATASGLTGGGDLSNDRTIALNISALQSKTNPSILDEVLIYDPVSLSHRKTTVSGITGYSGGGGGVTAHSALTGLNNDDHPQYSLANGTRWAANQTANRVAISTASGHLSVSSITTTQLEYLGDVTSVIQAQINAKAPINNPTFTGTVSGITKAMVGLNLIDNTSDANKPISTLQQAGLDLKAPINNPTFTGTVSGITKAMIGLNLVDNTSDANKPISTLQQAGLDLKASNSRVIATASGLSGGGDLSTDKTIALNISALQSKTTPSILDEVLIYDVSTSTHRRTTVSGITGYSGGGGGVTAHGALTGLNNDDHPQYSLANGTRWAANQTANRVAISTASGVLASSSITTTQLEYLSDVTSVIQAQINAKAPINNPIFTGTVSGVTKAMVGLNLVDNTSDANKPISALQQAGLDLKAPNSRIVATASGLTGGGNLSADRTIALNISALQSKTNPSFLDEVLIYDPVSLSHKKTTVSGITNQNQAWSTITETPTTLAGYGITDGGGGSGGGITNSQSIVNCLIFG